MPFDMNNDYSAAGPGAKRKVERLTLASIPRKIDGGRKRRIKPYQAHKPENAQEEIVKVTAKGLKAKITLLTLQYSSFGDIVDRLDREGYGPPTKVLISHVRDQAMSVLKVIMGEGLITEKALSRYREDAQEAQRRRFKRRD